MSSSISFKGLPQGTRYVSQKLIVGARQGLFGLRKLQKEEGVNLVIDFSSKKNFPFPFLEIVLCKLLRLKHKLIPIDLVNTDFPIKRALERAKKAIFENENLKIFVHCRSGKHRSVLIAAACEVLKKRINSPQEFEEFLKQNRFYEVRHVRKFFIPFKPTAEEISEKIKKLNLQKRRFLEIFFGKK